MNSLSDRQLMDRIISRLEEGRQQDGRYTARQLSGATSELIATAKQLNSALCRPSSQDQGGSRVGRDSLKKK